MKQLLNTYKLHDKRYLIKRDTIDISDYTGDQVFRIQRLIESNGLVWEYLKIDERKLVRGIHNI